MKMKNVEILGRRVNGAILRVCEVRTAKRLKRLANRLLHENRALALRLNDGRHLTAGDRRKFVKAATVGTK